MIHKSIQGVDVPSLGFGTYRLTGRACRRGVADAIAVGYRHVDTAQVYDNEEEVGQGIADSEVDRGDIFLTTKIWMDQLTPRGVRSSTEESLRKLKTDYVDLLLIHWPSDEMDLAAVLGAMNSLKEAGKTRSIGVSNFTPELMREAAKEADILTNQVEYHPLLDQRELIDTALSLDSSITAYSPIARGKALREDVIRSTASDHGKTPAQIVLRWLLQQEGVLAIPKASSSDHRRENFDVFDFELSESEMEAIRKVAHGVRIVDPSWAPAW